MTKGIQVLENVNASSDLPDISTIDTAGLYEIASGRFAPDYVAPSGYNGAEFTYWVSLFDDYTFTPPASGVSRYTFDNRDTDGTTAIDVWGDNNGTINGATTGVAGANQTYNTNEAYSFDGTDDYIDTFDVPFDETVDFTYSFWFKTQSSFSSTPGNIIGYFDNDSGGRGEITVRLFNGRVQGQINKGGGGSVLVETTSYNTGQWYNAVYVHRSGTGEDAIFLNGSKEGSSTSSPPTIGDSPLTNYIGARNRDDGTPETFFSGQIDDVRIYDKALTAQEVSDLYNNGSILP